MLSFFVLLVTAVVVVLVYLGRAARDCGQRPPRKI
jgi:hypothetical protein